MVLKLYHEPKTAIEFRPAWRLNDPMIARAATAFWCTENLLPPNANIEARQAVLCVAPTPPTR